MVRVVISVESAHRSAAGKRNGNGLVNNPAVMTAGTVAAVSTIHGVVSARAEDSRTTRLR